MVGIGRLKPARVDSVLMFSGREFQVLQEEKGHERWKQVCNFKKGRLLA